MKKILFIPMLFVLLFPSTAVAKHHHRHHHKHHHVITIKKLSAPITSHVISVDPSEANELITDATSPEERTEIEEILRGEIVPYQNESSELKTAESEDEVTFTPMTPEELLKQDIEEPNESVDQSWNQEIEEENRQLEREESQST